MNGYAKVDIVVSINGKEVALQTTHIKNFANQPLTQEIACSLLKLSCMNGITGMVIQDVPHVLNSIKG